MCEIKIKIVLVGNTKVGKTAFAIRCRDGVFAENTEVTLTINSFNKKVSYEGQAYQLEIWDTAGQERYSDIVPLSYRDADFVLMMFSCDDSSTLEGLGQWESSVLSAADENTIICVVATKSDVLNNEEEENATLNRAKRKFPNIDETRFFIISSKRDKGIDDMLSILVRSCFEARHEKPKETNEVNLNDNPNPKSCC